MTETPTPETPCWYCVRTQCRREQIAAEQLRKLDLIEVYAPRIRFRRATRRGPVWFEEALFPGYVFARFDFLSRRSEVQYSIGVTGFVRFGGKPAVLEDPILESLRRAMQDREVKVFEEEPLKPGDRTVILEGPFAGIEVVVRTVLPASERVRVLFEFLGQSTELVIERHALEKGRAHPLRNRE
ncbi:MAG: transcription termination/antitermination NusG family protein [Kiritimatiellia bacterium]|nr:transcription termination/antitermination NusG family protein [Kiritimatiellia bacterium]